MKRLFVAVLLTAFALPALAQEGGNYGEPVKEKKAISVDQMKKKVESKETWEGVVTGQVKEVCKSEGCWLRLDDGSASGIMVKMKDHSFFVPKDIDGKKVYILGKASVKTTSVDQLKHYAEDAGKSKAEIDAITSPKVEITVDASGVKVV
jgi:hypothetical protein